MECERARELIESRLNDSQLAEHLAGCAECTAMQTVISLAAELPAEDLPPGFETSLRLRLGASSTPVRRRLWSSVFGFGAAVAAALVVGTLVLPRTAHLLHTSAPSGGAKGATAAATFAGSFARAASSPASSAAATATIPGGAGTVSGAPAALNAPPGLPPAAGGSALAPGLPGVGTRLIERQVSATLEVSDVEAAFDRLRGSAAAAGGFVGQSSLDRAGGGMTAWLDLRVPVDRLPSFLAAMRATGRLQALSESGEDVTENYVDVNARLGVLKAEAAAYERLLGQAKGVGEVLQVEQALAPVQAQIESLEAEQRLTAGLAALASVHVELQPAPMPVGVLQASWNALLAGANRATLALVWLLPWAALGGVAWLGVVVFRRQRGVR